MNTNDFAAIAAAYKEDGQLTIWEEMTEDELRPVASAHVTVSGRDFPIDCEDPYAYVGDYWTFVAAELQHHGVDVSAPWDEREIISENEYTGTTWSSYTIGEDQ